jgi:predicted nucleotidyltransferase
MIEVNEHALSEMVQAIVREVDPEQVILFGSRVRGQAGRDSDVDLMIIERAPFNEARSRWNELERIRLALSSFRVPKDILVFSSDEVKRWRDSLNHIIGTTLREGKQLYARP